MSSYGASSCTFCPEALYASGISDSLPTAVGLLCCRSASPCWGKQMLRNPSPAPRRRTRRARYGSAHDAAAAWPSWSDSRLPTRDFALRPPPVPTYDLLFLMSILASAAAPARDDCPPLVPSHRSACLPFPVASRGPPDTSFSTNRIPVCQRQHNSKYITAEFQTGSLQVALSKTPRHRSFTPSFELNLPGRFRYSHRT